ncbi:bifunctional phosphopantothenoylcysteine decarboxylase/phosphopantothenate--cysteine ligase CoaBC [Alicyclobacillus mali]|uniref:Coenzyme A biosynthesis bifunctional protein CoaBC n=1 Tax=Alicyclobacillus mali (ex Roth et al. 2021) TaxID=1123961 RepID=A0ABS0F2T0_9BACL|nr:bifunctional phosphopantothenoylcysteine decarboxylase/phosphopantothenate--cysteine ligase CoaBC [Alicyclobacillus mali (ex Roth et al. 2021)]MBF8377608.1 bifunctional phosphopantothenoylcysteine decarboxylase/phosphopantothenate--cysteine ligase CoaBC [Alicyclobacillus mali (ex Roth et al. 2021)]MCL6488550.1 bifunctional phosphopantothenoylcysteine decarboxylase/phosphopantothenate--cysteine ligase CoaBC [Alicyclobacillus mali (ex Roth et al. 2021)]
MDKKTILVGVGGGIAAYKSANLCSLLVKRGYEVQVLMTEHATRFIQPLTLQALTKHPVIFDTFAEPNPSEIAHIAVADRADLYVIAPATANLIAKLAHGLADDMVTTTALAATCPTVVAPAMNVHMFDHPAVQENLDILRRRGTLVLDPGEGPLACGYTGRGRMPEPEDIADVIEAVLHQEQDLDGLSILITAGPTVEDIDPVRYLTNRSSGKMGYALAEQAARRGARVTLISGPTHLKPVPGARMIYVRSTEQMLHAVSEFFAEADAFISAAAPADFRPARALDHKWKKSQGPLKLDLVETPDILLTVSRAKRPGQVVVGFAAETDTPVEHARRKLAEKGLDLIVVNDVTKPGAGFEVDTNQVTLIAKDGSAEALPVMEKHRVADHILTRVRQVLRVSDGERPV